MKRILCMAMTFLLAVMMLPQTGYAAVDEGLEKVLVTARQKYDIPDDAEFNYSVYQREQGSKVWNLHWTSRDKDADSLDIAVLEDGSVIRYDRYKPYNFQGKKLPKVDEEKARLDAESFIKKSYPEILPYIKLSKSKPVETLKNYYYQFNYVREENGIPFFNDVVNVSVNHQTGEVTNYNVQWSDLEFPAPENIITLDQAQQAFIRNIGMELVYRHRLQDGKVTTFAVYTPALDSTRYAIDAFNGKAAKLSDRYDIFFDEAFTEKQKVMMAAGDFGSISLSPEELEAIRKGAELLDESDAVSVAFKTQVLELNDSYKLMNSSLSKNYGNKDEILWRLYFEKSNDDKTAGRITSVVIDALTGEIRSFDKSYYTDPADKAKYNREQAKKEVEAFLSWFAPGRFKETKYFDKYNSYEENPDELPRVQMFKYTRVVDGIPYPDNAISVMYDTVAGKISAYNLTWYDVDFPDLKNAVPLETIYKNLFDMAGLKLQYKIDYSEKEGERVRLVYSLSPADKPVDFDAFTGKPVYSDGSPWKEEQAFEYTDVEDSYAAHQIKTLARYGIGFGGGLFKPKERVTQLDFFMLFSRVLDGYYGPGVTPESTQEEIDELYEYLVRSGVIKREEKNPKALISKEECVKYVVRALGLEKAAVIPGIYKTKYEDEASISEGFLGYVAIASGLGIVQGSNGRFNPGQILTREQAAVIIYNYLTH